MHIQLQRIFLFIVLKLSSYFFHVKSKKWNASHVFIPKSSMYFCLFVLATPLRYVFIWQTFMDGDAAQCTVVFLYTDIEFEDAPATFKGIT